MNEACIILLRWLGAIKEAIYHTISHIGNLYNELNTIFNNRELAIGLWIIIFIIFALTIKGVREQLPNLTRSLFCKQFILWYLSMTAYFLFIIYLLIKIGFWDISLLKETILWFFVVGIVSSGRAIGKAKDLRYFIDFVRDNVKALIIVEFIVNLYCYSFLWEVIQVFILVFLSILLAVIEVRPEFQNQASQLLKKIINAIIAIIGFSSLIHSIRLFYINFESIALSQVVKDFLLPSLLSIMFVLYIYLLVVFTAYEQLFLRLSFRKTIDDSYRNYLKIRILMFCNININRISNFISRSNIMCCYIRNKNDVKKIFDNYKRKDTNATVDI